MRHHSPRCAGRRPFPDFCDCEHLPRPGARLYSSSPRSHPDGQKTIADGMSWYVRQGTKPGLARTYLERRLCTVVPFGTSSRLCGGGGQALLLPPTERSSRGRPLRLQRCLPPAILRMLASRPLPVSVDLIMQRPFLCACTALICVIPLTCLGLMPRCTSHRRRGARDDSVWGRGSVGQKWWAVQGEWAGEREEICEACSGHRRVVPAQTRSDGRPARGACKMRPDSLDFPVLTT